MRRSRLAGTLVALAAVLVVFLQLPGPATCPNAAWRFTGLALDGLDADPPDERSSDTTDHADALVPRRPVLPHIAGHTTAVPDSAPLHAGYDVVVDAGVTRAPPGA